MARKYEQLNRPMQRRRILKELASSGKSTKERRTEFSVSRRELRRAVASLFSFKPLSPLTQEEKSVLKDFTMAKIEDGMTRNTVQALGFLSGNIKARQKTTEEYARLTRPEILRTLTKPEEFEKTNVRVEGMSKGTDVGSLIRHALRGLKIYNQMGVDLESIAREAHERTGKPAVVMDVGASTGIMLDELKKEMGDDVETHALRLEDSPKRNADFDHLLTAEHMPAEFREKFDGIASHATLEFSILPHLALRNMALALAPEGKAQMRWLSSGHQLYSPPFKKLVKKIEAFYSGYKAAELSPEAEKLLEEETRRKNDNRSVKELVAEDLKKYKVYAKISIAWLNEIARLKAMPEYKVRINQWENLAVGRMPIDVEIERL